MNFTSDYSSKKLTGPAQDALNRMKNTSDGKIHGAGAVVRETQGGPPIPAPNDIEHHLQGVAMWGDSEVFFTTSGKGGRVIGATKSPGSNDYLVTKVSDPVGAQDEECHPGGIQIIGNVLAVPVYSSRGRAEIQFRDLTTANLTVIKKVAAIGGNPYCVGLVDTLDPSGNPFYLLAVVTAGDGKEVAVFKSSPGLMLNEADCRFTHLKTFSHSSADWRGYANNISLLANSTGGVYLLGFGNSFLLDEDYIDVFRFQPARDDVEIVREASFRFSCTGGSGFRWGASGAVTGGTAVTVCACERDVQNKSRIRMNIFSPAPSVIA